MHQLQFLCMQQQAWLRRVMRFGVQRVADDRVADRGQMHTQLVRAPGERLQLQARALQRAVSRCNTCHSVSAGRPASRSMRWRGRCGQSAASGQLMQPSSSRTMPCTTAT